MNECFSKAKLHATFTFLSVKSCQTYLVSGRNQQSTKSTPQNPLTYTILYHCFGMVFSISTVSLHTTVSADISLSSFKELQSLIRMCWLSNLHFVILAFCNSIFLGPNIVVSFYNYFTTLLLQLNYIFYLQLSNKGRIVICSLSF